MNPPPRKICGKCRSPLNTRKGADGTIAYPHGATDCGVDDPIDPDGGSITYRCDFCLGLNPIWTFPCAEVQDPNVLLMVDEDGDIESSDSHISAGDWAACDECKPLIEAQDWHAMWARNAHLAEVREKMPQHFHAARYAVLNLWLEFTRQRTGTPYRQAHDPQLEPEEART